MDPNINLRNLWERGIDCQSLPDSFPSNIEKTLSGLAEASLLKTFQTTTLAHPDEGLGA
jgi:hypothetical protein